MTRHGSTRTLGTRSRMLSSLATAPRDQASGRVRDSFWLTSVFHDLTGPGLSVRGNQPRLASRRPSTAQLSVRRS